jgi:excisionase family DNA binding protein
MVEPLTLTVRETAAALKLSVPQTYRLIEQGRIPATSLGPRLTRVPLDQLRAQLAAARTPGAPGHTA